MTGGMAWQKCGLHTHTQTHRQTGKQANTQAYTQTDSQTNRQTEAHCIEQSVHSVLCVCVCVFFLSVLCVCAEVAATQPPALCAEVRSANCRWPAVRKPMVVALMRPKSLVRMLCAHMERSTFACLILATSSIAEPLSQLIFLQTLYCTSVPCAFKFIASSFVQSNACFWRDILGRHEQQQEKRRKKVQRAFDLQIAICKTTQTM